MGYGEFQDPKMEVREYHVSGHMNWEYVPLHSPEK